MIIALRYVEKDDGYWEVRTETTITPYTSLRQFQEEKEIVALAARALQQPGTWGDIAEGRDYETG